MNSPFKPLLGVCLGFALCAPSAFAASYEFRRVITSLAVAPAASSPSPGAATPGPTAAAVGTFTVPAVSYGAAPFTLVAPTSESPGAWSFSSSNSAVATVSGNTVTVLAGGTSTITATQAATSSYSSTIRTATLTVSAADAVLGAWPALNKAWGEVFTLTPPSSPSTGSWSYSSSDPSAVQVAGNTVTALKVGTYTLTATQAATNNHKAGSTSTTVTLAKATPTLEAWPALSVTTLQAPFTLVYPNSNSTGAWSATSSNPAVATVSNGVVTVVSEGTATLTATQASTPDYQGATLTTTLTVSVGYASSCKTYLQAFPSATSGWYTLDVDGAGPAVPQSYYCDMTSDGGGWTRIVRQTEAAPVTNWNGGTNGSSYALSTLNIPSHTQVGFGKDDAATVVDYVNWTYQTGNIAAALVSSPKSGLQYYVHRNASQFYSYHDPRSQLYTQAGDVNGTWANTLALTRNSGATGSGSVGWAFTPANETAVRRGFRMQSSLLWTTSESYAWTVWVR